VLEAASGGEARVTAHLNDFLYIAYWHDPEDGFVNLDEADVNDADTASTGSVVKRGPGEEGSSGQPLISENVGFTFIPYPPPADRKTGDQPLGNTEPRGQG
jgi:hypothetical protein